MVAALLPEAGADGGALLLDHGALVGDGLGCADVADELLDCGVAWAASVPSVPVSASLSATDTGFGLGSRPGLSSGADSREVMAEGCGKHPDRAAMVVGPLPGG